MAMRIVPDLEVQQYSPADGDVRREFILADATPSELPTTGEGVDGMPDSAKLAHGSVLWDLYANKKHVLYETTWHEV